MTTDRALNAAIDALKSNQPQVAVDRLTEAIEHDLEPELLHRVRSLRSQSYMLLGKTQEALVDWREAWRGVQETGDATGIQALRSLRRDIAQTKASKAAAQQQRMQSQKRIETGEATSKEGTLEEQLNALLELANAHMDCESWKEGRTLANQIIRKADRHPEELVRFAVLGRLCLIRALHDGQEELLQTALRLADEANEMQLVGAVARAAKAVGYEFPPLEF
jgi:tetratricopeptide (TPR) repeat protein